MNYSVILFDADGVLIQSQHQFSDLLSAEYGISEGKLQAFFAGPFRACSLGKTDLKEALAKVVDDWGWEGTVDELLHFWFTKGTVIDKDVAAFTRELRGQGIKTYLTTDQERYRGEFLRQKLSGTVVDGVFFSAEIGAQKKDRAFFAYVHEAIGQVDPSRVLFIDDSKGNIEVAKRFGFQTHFYTNLKELKRFFGSERL